MFNVAFTDTAEKQLAKLDRSIQERFLNTLERIRTRPEAYVKRLVGSPHYSLRVGDYRAILDIKQEILLILVLEVGHRSKVYK